MQKPIEKALDEEEINKIKNIYSTKYHGSNSDIFFEQVKNIPHKRMSEIIDTVAKWELNKGHKSEFEATNCIMKNVKDPESKLMVFNHFDRGCMYNMKQFIISSIEYCCLDSCSIMISFISVFISIILFYADVYKDVISFDILHHISSTILVSLYFKIIEKLLTYKYNCRNMILKVLVI